MQGLAGTLRLILKRGKWIGTSSDYPYHRCSLLLFTPHIWEQLVTFLRMVCSIRTTHALSWQVMTFLVPGPPVRCTNMLISEEFVVLIAPPWQNRANMRPGYGSIDAGCEFDGKPSGSDYENNFGKFGDVNMNQDHRCSFSPASTAQHWFGAKYDE